MATDYQLWNPNYTTSVLSGSFTT